MKKQPKKQTKKEIIKEGFRDWLEETALHGWFNVIASARRGGGGSRGLGSLATSPLCAFVIKAGDKQNVFVTHHLALSSNLPAAVHDWASPEHQEQH